MKSAIKISIDWKNFMFNNFVNNVFAMISSIIDFVLLCKEIFVTNSNFCLQMYSSLFSFDTIFIETRKLWVFKTFFSFIMSRVVNFVMTMIDVILIEIVMFMSFCFTLISRKNDRWFSLFNAFNILSRIKLFLHIDFWNFCFFKSLVLKIKVIDIIRVNEFRQKFQSRL